MKTPLLLCSATIMEAQPLLDYFSVRTTDHNLYHLSEGLDFLITGIGPNHCLKSLYQLSYLPKKVLNFGIAGSLVKQFDLLELCYPNYCIDGDQWLSFAKETSICSYEANPNLTIASCGRPIHDLKAKTKLSEMASLVDMESYSIALYCQHHQIPLHFVKCVSDYCEQDGKNLIKKNLPKASEILFEEVKKLFSL